MGCGLVAVQGIVRWGNRQLHTRLARLAGSPWGRPGHPVSWALGLALCLPSNNYVAVLTPSTSECDPVWRQGPCRCNTDEVVLRSAEPLILGDCALESQPSEGRHTRDEEGRVWSPAAAGPGTPKMPAVPRGGKRPGQVSCSFGGRSASPAPGLQISGNFTASDREQCVSVVFTPLSLWSFVPAAARSKSTGVGKVLSRTSRPGTRHVFVTQSSSCPSCTWWGIVGVMQTSSWV